jgi:hypothetical protein
MERIGIPFRFYILHSTFFILKIGLDATRGEILFF